MYYTYKLLYRFLFLIIYSNIPAASAYVFVVGASFFFDEYWNSLAISLYNASLFETIHWKKSECAVLQCV